MAMNRYDIRVALLLAGGLFVSAAVVAESRPQVAAAAPAVEASAASVPAVTPIPLPNLDVRYEVSWGGFGAGEMQIVLKADAAHPGCYRYEALSHPNALVAALYGSPNQLSVFCVHDGSIRSQRFESTLPGDSKQSYTLDFDWSQLMVTDNNGKTRKLPSDAIDSFALQQAVRLWVQAHAQDAQPPLAEFTMVDNKNLTHYQFRLSGHEQMQTPAGSFETLRLERIDNPQKIGRFWLAPALGYMPVVIETKNGGKPMVRMELTQG